MAVRHITTVEENNTLFPDRRITVRGVAIDHGLMNLVGTSMGGIPMCHGAGGMAGHVRFGARTGGSLVILGLVVLFVGLFLADSAATLFKLVPTSALGAILFFGGLELAAGSHGSDLDKNNRYFLFVTAGVSMWNMVAGYLAGLLLWHCFQRGCSRPDLALSTCPLKLPCPTPEAAPRIGSPLPVALSGKCTGIPIPEEWVKAREPARMGRSPDY